MRKLAAENSFWGEGLGHCGGGSQPSDQHQQWELSMTSVQTGKSPNRVLWTHFRDLVSYINAFFGLIWQSRFVCEFCSSCTKLYSLISEPSDLASSESQLSGKMLSLT